jgi:flagellar hook protein FlgE
MVGFNAYQSSTLAMRSNAHALNTIGQNIANVNTGGYKRTDTYFKTLISETLDTNQSDLGGIRPKDYQVIDQQGVITATTRDLDLAIVGDGFYQLSNSLTSFNEENLFYSRDGAFRIVKTDETSSVTADDGSTITINNAYLADKNGYYLLGWAPETNGSFSNTGTPAPMRVDGYAFSTITQPTTEVKLSLNLPANASVITDHAASTLDANNGNTNPEMENYTIEVVDSNGKKQTANLNFTKSATHQWEVSATTSRSATPRTSSLIIQGTVEAGDTYTVTVNGNAVSYTTTGTETDLASVRANIVAAINADTVVSNRVTATAGTANGEITLKETTGSTTAQIDTVTISGTVEAGDQYTVTVGGSQISYTATGLETGLASVRNGLLAVIDANAGISALVTAAAGAADGQITLTAITAGTPFNSSATANVKGATTDNTAASSTTLGNDDGTTLTTQGTTTYAGAVAQNDTITLAGTLETGDVYSATINGTTVSYTVTGAEGSINGVRDALVNAINGDSNVNGIVTTSSAGTGAFTLAAQAAGETLIISASATNVASGVDDSTATLVNTTSAIAVSNDNNIVTASSTNYQTTAAQTFNYSQMGAIITNPATLNFALAFADGATSTIDLDISSFTQFGDDFLPYEVSNDGLAKANMIDVSFDARGHVLGKFDDGTERLIYKLPLSQFTNPNGLEPMNGMVFKESFNSGTAQTVATDVTGEASFSPYALELSNVDITGEFTKMMMVQNAYNSNATVFKTVDEMVMVARDLKA